MVSPFELELEPIAALREIKGVQFPAELRFRQLIVTGPPGSGKSRLMAKIGGWPEEGYIDLTQHNWWRAQALTFRPREVHLGLPFVGFPDALTVFDKAWLEAPRPPALEPTRIVLPPPKTYFWTADWRGRFMFEFLIPPPEGILRWRLDRSRRDAHPVDEGVSLEQVEQQVSVYRQAALHLHRCKMLIYIREGVDQLPKKIVDSG